MIPSSSIIGFINNAALLLVLGLLCDIFSIDKSGVKSAFGRILLGAILGCVGVAITAMLLCGIKVATQPLQLIAARTWHKLRYYSSSEA
jgi:hypothetical protein